MRCPPFLAEERLAGRHEICLDARPPAPGPYVLPPEAGGAIRTRRFAVVR